MKFGFVGGAGFKAKMHMDTSATQIVNSNLFFIIIFFTSVVFNFAVLKIFIPATRPSHLPEADATGLIHGAIPFSIIFIVYDLPAIYLHDDTRIVLYEAHMVHGDRLCGDTFISCLQQCEQGVLSQV
jgi:hypothetical protein